MLQVRGESCGKMDAFNDDSSSASSSGDGGGGGSSAGAAGQFTAVQATQAVDMIEIPFQPAEGTTAAIVAGGWAFNRCQDNPTYSSTLKFHMKALLGDLRMSFSKALVSKTSNIQAVEEFVAPESAVLEGCAWCCMQLHETGRTQTQVHLDANTPRACPILRRDLANTGPPALEDRKGSGLTQVVMLTS